MNVEIVQDQWDLSREISKKLGVPYSRQVPCKAGRHDYDMPSGFWMSDLPLYQDIETCMKLALDHFVSISADNEFIYTNLNALTTQILIADYDNNKLYATCIGILRALKGVA